MNESLSGLRGPSVQLIQAVEPAAQASAQRSRMGDGPGAILGGFGVAFTGLEVGHRPQSEGVERFRVGPPAGDRDPQLVAQDLQIPALT